MGREKKGWQGKKFQSLSDEKKKEIEERVARRKVDQRARQIEIDQRGQYLKDGRAYLRENRRDVKVFYPDLYDAADVTCAYRINPTEDGMSKVDISIAVCSVDDEFSKRVGRGLVGQRISDPELCESILVPSYAARNGYIEKLLETSLPIMFKDVFPRKMAMDLIHCLEC